MATLRKGSNLLQVHSRNLSVVLEAVRRLGLVSRTELTEHTLLTPSTVTNLVHELEEFHLLAEAGSTASQGGRNRTLLSLNPNAYWVMAVSAQDSVRGALINLAGATGWQAELNLPTNANSVTFATLCSEMVALMQQAASERHWNVAGLGLAVNWLLEPHDSLWWTSWQPPCPASLRLRVENSLRAAALAETWFGAGQTAGSLLYLEKKAPLQAGIVYNRVLFPGAHGFAATCMQPGVVRANPVWHVYDTEGLSQGEMHANTARILVQAYDPEMVVLDSPELLDLLPTLAPGPEYVKAVLGVDAPLIGAATLVLEELFADPLGFLAAVPLEQGGQIGSMGGI